MPNEPACQTGGFPKQERILFRSNEEQVEYVEEYSWARNKVGTFMCGKTLHRKVQKIQWWLEGRARRPQGVMEVGTTGSASYCPGSVLSGRGSPAGRGGSGFHMKYGAH